LLLFRFRGGRRLPAVLPGHRMTDSRVACCITIAMLAVPLSRSFPEEEKS
jgi:hypothetical protein